MKNLLIAIEGQHRCETDAFARKLARCLDFTVYDSVGRILGTERDDYEEVMALIRQQRTLFAKELAWRGVVMQDSHLRAKAEHEARNGLAYGTAALPGSPDEYLLPNVVVLVNPPENQTFAYLRRSLEERGIPRHEIHGVAVSRSPVVGPTIEYLAQFLTRDDEFTPGSAPTPRTAAPRP